jgi:heterodisulfide reductase subunit C
LAKCAGCEACYSICPSCISFEGYDPRAVIKDILEGDHEKWLTSESIWQCLECHYCIEMCYQHYGFENAMTAMRTIATKKGLYPVQVKRGWEIFVKTGKLGEPALPARKKFGLPEPKKGAPEEFKKLHDLVRRSREKGAQEG